MAHLEKTIEKLNAPEIIDGIELESQFNFQIRIEDGFTLIYDSNENYHINYLEDLNYLMYDAAQEFGFPFHPIKKDKVMEQLLEAIKLDFGKDAYFEWEDSVTMIVEI